MAIKSNLTFSSIGNLTLIFVNKFIQKLINSLRDKDDDKIGFFISFLLHVSIIIVAIGIPSCFQPKTIDIPNIVPIEILNIDEITRVPEKPVISEKITEIENKKTKEVKFSNADQSEIVKIQDDPEDLKNIVEEKEDVPKILQEKDMVSPLMKEKPKKNDVEFETLPSKKIKPKIKPEKKIKTEKISDIVVKIKNKPKPSFNIATVLKDLRKEKSNPLNEDEKKEDKSETEKDNKSKADNVLSISQIDLLKQQLYGCWTVPAGAKGAKDMEVKVRVWVNPDKTVSNARILDTNRMQNDPYFRTVAESALRAVLNPACKTLKLPTGKYEVWKKFVFKFELDWMLGN